MHDDQKKLTGIIGYPLRQSLSPFLHNYWINKYKLNSYYIPFAIKDIPFAEVMERTENAVIKGIKN